MISNKIYRKIKSRRVEINHAAEVGVYLPETSNVIHFINDNVRTTLVEADPDVNHKIAAFFKEKNITLHPYAVWDYNGTLHLCRAKASTFVSELPSSPAIVNDKYVLMEEDTMEVPCLKFSEIDDGTIDLLCIDIEGAEWYVIKHLRSRPKVLSIETHGKYYTNPFIQEIKQWLIVNNYREWYKDKSDTVFVREDVLQPSINDRVSILFTNMKLKLKKIKGFIKTAFD